MKIIYETEKEAYWALTFQRVCTKKKIGCEVTYSKELIQKLKGGK